LVQAFLKKWWVESDFKAPNLPLSLEFKKCDVQNYQKLVTEQITDMDLLGIIDCEEQISKIIEILNNGVDKCAKKSKSRSKRSKPWTPEINLEFIEKFVITHM
jgi:hypothetical protein